MKKITGILITLTITTLLLSGCTTNQDNPDENNSDENQDGNGSILFDYPPFDLDKVYYILPMGAMVGGHVTPVDHQYYAAYDYGNGEESVVDIDVYSPANGTATSIQHMSVAAGDPPIPVDDFRLTIQHTSAISSYYIHVDELSEKLSAVDPGPGNYTSVNVQVSAGEIIGRFGGIVDYNVVDENVELGFINPDNYEYEPWKIHCPDPFDYFNDQIKNQMIQKCLRTEEPIGGKICYDIDGRLVGTWFEEGTNGYGGVDPEKYWVGHLSIVYDSIDPNQIVISTGSYDGKPDQFGVKGNSPDPANISVDDGLVIYELTDFEYYKNDTIWDRNSLVKGLKARNNDFFNGVILLQLLEDRKLKVEIFPNETANSFTENAKIYER